MPGLLDEEDKLLAEEETTLKGQRGTGFVLRVAAPGTVLAFPVPRSGAVTVGRGLDAEVRVPLPDMSRKHLGLRWADGKLQIADVGSSNGTTLRGERLAPNDWKPLELREPFFVSDIALVVHEGNAADGPKRLVGYEAFEATLQAQLRTFAKSKEPFGVCAIDVEHEAAWADFILALLSKNDIVGYVSDSSLRILLLDRTPAQLDVLATFFQRALTTFTPARKVVMRACPRDGDSLGALYGGARERPREAVAHETRRPSAPVVQSNAMRKVYALVDDVARTATSILILGETGVGKDVLAKAIHQRSDRFAAPLVGLNCAALPESLLESELFGYERGAFTGAVAPKMGLLESAEGGTVFLDEVGEMPLSTQAKLLRVLEDRKLMRLGGLKPKSVNFRLLAATNRNLQAEIAAGRFRADLFYRINGLAISIPPLRERRDEIVSLALHFAERAAATLGKPVPLFVPDTLHCFERYTWPGNIRELRSVVERAVLLARRGPVLPEHLPEEVISQAASVPPPSAATPGPGPAMPFAEALTEPRLPVLAADDDDEDESPGRGIARVIRTATLPPAMTGADANDSAPSSRSLKEEIERLEHQRIVAALQEYGGNQTRAAQALGMTRRALIIRLDRYGLPRPRKANEKS